MQPPLDHKEVATVVSQLNKKGYQYKCKDQPINSFCNVNVCKTRKHGVGAENVSQQLGALSKLETEPLAEAEGAAVFEVLAKTGLPNNNAITGKIL